MEHLTLLCHLRDRTALEMSIRGYNYYLALCVIWDSQMFADWSMDDLVNRTPDYAAVRDTMVSYLKTLGGERHGNH